MIALSVGHDAQAKGASHNGRYEFDVSSEWVPLIGQLLIDNHDIDVVLVPDGKLIPKVKWINEMPGILLAAELHFNSDVSKKQRGSETLYCPGSARGKHAASLVQMEMAGVFPPNRGYKEGWYRMDAPGRVDYPGDVDGDEHIDYFLKATNPVALILEPEFIYNEKLIDDNKLAACTRIAAGLNSAYMALKPAGEVK